MEFQRLSVDRQGSPVGANDALESLIYAKGASRRDSRNIVPFDCFGFGMPTGSWNVLFPPPTRPNLAELLAAQIYDWS